MNAIPTHCHNCRNALSPAEIAEIKTDRHVMAVVAYFGQAACNKCCGKASSHNRRA